MKKTFTLLCAALLMACGGEKKAEETTAAEETPAANEAETAEPEENFPAPIGECPASSAISEFKTTSGSYGFINDFAFDKATNAGAVTGSDRSRVKISFTNNTKLSAIEMNETVVRVPVENKDEFIVAITLNNSLGEAKKIVPGDYVAGNEYGKMSLMVEVCHKAGDSKQGTASIMSLEKGKVTVLSISKDKICGTFDLDGTTTAKGTFSLPLVHQ